MSQTIAKVFLIFCIVCIIIIELTRLRPIGEAYNADVAFGYLYIQRMLGFADYKRQALFVFIHICFTTNKLVDQRDILGQDAIVKLLMNSKCSYREGEVFLQSDLPDRN